MDSCRKITAGNTEKNDAKVSGGMPEEIPEGILELISGDSAGDISERILDDVFMKSLEDFRKEFRRISDVVHGMLSTGIFGKN